MKKTIKLLDLDCGHCADKIQNAVKKIDGVTSVSVNFLGQKMVLEAPDDQFDAVLAEAKTLIKQIEPDVTVWYLMQKDSCVSELAQKMEVTESAISHQLRALRIVRLVQSRKAGKSVIYSLQDEHIRWILEETYAHISER